MFQFIKDYIFKSSSQQIQERIRTDKEVFAILKRFHQDIGGTTISLKPSKYVGRGRHVVVSSDGETEYIVDFSKGKITSTTISPNGRQKIVNYDMITRQYDKKVV